MSGKGTKRDAILDEWGDFLRRSSPRRVAIRLDVVPDVLAWLLLHWQRYADSIPDMPSLANVGQVRYVDGVRQAVRPKMAAVEELIQALTDGFPDQAWLDAALRAGMLIGAKDDAGVPLHKIGRALLGIGGSDDGTTPDTRGGVVPFDPGATPQPDESA